MLASQSVLVCDRLRPMELSISHYVHKSNLEMAQLIENFATPMLSCPCVSPSQPERSREARVFACVARPTPASSDLDLFGLKLTTAWT
jgi:hypothetical protein